MYVQPLLVSVLLYVLSPSDAASARHGCNGCTSRGQAEAKVSVNLSSYLFELSEQFLSVTMDAAYIRRNWGVMNFTLPRVLNMAKALSPAMLRVGGTSEDFLLFGESRAPSGPPNTTNFTMTGRQWDEVNHFVEAVGWDIIFGLNLLLRHPWPNGSWDSTNAEQLMKYSKSQGYKVNWELGNEPGLIPEKAPNIPVSPEQDARDHHALKDLVKSLSPDSKFLVGPDTIANRNGLDYFSNFLQALEDDVINAATWHHYYVDCQTAKLPEDFYSVTVLDSFIDLAQTIRGNVTVHRPDAELWLGETSSCVSQYASTVPSTYVAGFMWLDKLGISALTNNTRVFRQDITGGTYALLNDTLYPRPDYWLSLLYKRLVGRKVLNVTGSLQPGRYVRVYSHCALPPYTSGSVVLLILNLNMDKATVSLMNQELAQSGRDVYWLTAPAGSMNITSLEVALNGETLRLAGDSVPDLKPLQEQPSSSLSLPPLSFGFYVFRDVRASACK